MSEHTCKIQRGIWQRRRKFIDAVKLTAGCVDCGYRQAPEALQFDHIDPTTKYKPVGRMAQHSIEKIVTEMMKCVVRCANCHAIKTWSV